MKAVIVGLWQSPVIPRKMLISESLAKGGYAHWWPNVSSIQSGQLAALLILTTVNNKVSTAYWKTLRAILLQLLQY